jgi:hypothetical protein
MADAVFCIPELTPIPAFEALMRKLSTSESHSKDRPGGDGGVGQG